MTVEECYEKMGGNYQEVVGRLRNDERIVKFLLRILDDGSYALLCSSLESGNAGEAFRAAHTIKGICLNLSLDKLYRSSNELTEALRGKDSIGEDVGPLFERVKTDYAETMACIAQLKG